MRLLRKYYYIIFILFFLIIFSLNYCSYNRSVERINSNFDREIELIKSNVFSSLENAFAAYSISDLILTKEMKANSKILLEKYKKDPHPKDWNLALLKDKMPGYEIYVINRNLKIINTTLKADSGLKLSQYPELSGLIYAYFESEKFTADKFSLGRKTGLINKYSYYPTPDQKYILELSINIKERFPILADFNIFQAAEDLKDQYQQLRSINFYKFFEKSNHVNLLNSSSNSKEDNISPTEKNMIKNTVNNKEISTQIKNISRFQITNIYLPVLISENVPDADWWKSFIVQVSYDNQQVVKALEEENFEFLFNIVIILVLFIIFSLTMIYLIKQTETLAYYDHLTGLLNRKAFERHFNQEKNRKLDKKLALLYLDLDDFKKVNDNYGHDIGDLLLKLVSQRLKNAVRNEDKVSRIGGDEFTVLLTNIKTEADVKKVIAKIEAKLKEPFQIKGNEISISSSIGYSIGHRDQSLFQTMLIQADSEMYKNKNDKK